MVFFTVTALLWKMEALALFPAALVGGLTGPLDAAYAQGLTAAFPICPGPMPLEKALTEAEENLLAAARNALRLFLAGNK